MHPVVWTGWNYAFSKQSVRNFLTTKSISSRVLFLENEKRTHGRSLSAWMACNTCDPIADPELHALPPEAEIPEISRLNSSISAMSVHGKDAFSTVYKLFSRVMSPLNWIPW